MILFGKSFIKFCMSFIKFDKAPSYTDMQLGQGKTTAFFAFPAFPYSLSPSRPSVCVPCIGVDDRTASSLIKDAHSITAHGGVCPLSQVLPLRRRLADLRHRVSILDIEIGALEDELLRRGELRCVARGRRRRPLLNPLLCHIFCRRPRFC